MQLFVINNKQRWNKNKCRGECTKFIDKGICDKGFIEILVIVSVNVIQIAISVNI